MRARTTTFYSFSTSITAGTTSFRLISATNLASDADRDEIEAQRRVLKDRFVLALRPILQPKQQPPNQQPLSLKADIKHQRFGGGGDDERDILLVSVENDGEQDATDFRLDVDFPASFLDGGGHRLQVQSAIPGFVRFRITNKDEACRREHLYPGDTTQNLISFPYAVRGQIQREVPEQLQEKVTATVFSGNMKPKKTVMAIAELMG